ncbi:MAG: aminotransferase class I/II-fold pyridoxal phosphate-dependent enzyme [Thermoleophilia bacterium]|nr:aminotransferase class I/II-fold pyridoxal phosphate-dependent enzyme [Thermoleophilia bacterium]
MSPNDVPVDLRSDTVTRPTPGMRRAMAEAEVGDDVFGEDPTINRLQDRVAELLGKEAALFVASGTMGNQLCVRTQTQPGDEVLIHEGGHVLNYEGGSAAALSGVQLRALPGAHGILDPADIRRAIWPRQEHFHRTRLLCLENTHNRAGGTIWPLPAMDAAVAAAREAGLDVHLDGARLWNAHVATGVPLSDYAARADSVSVCFSKGLGAPVGSVIAGPRQFIEQARFHRKKYGGAMRQVGILGAACLYALDYHIERLADDHANAALLAERLREVPGLEIPHPVDSNIVIVELAGMALTAAGVVPPLAQAGVLAIAADHTRVRFVTHMDVSAEQVAWAAGTAVRVLAGLSGA